MKSVLISIQPKWCALIANGEKTIEVRKTRPKLQTPFKCYIYCTNTPKYHHLYNLTEYNNGQPLYSVTQHNKYSLVPSNYMNGKVIGEFVCDDITQYECEFEDDETYESIREVYKPEDFIEYAEYAYETIADNETNRSNNSLCKSSCLNWEELREYIGRDFHTFYAWHISELKIYDKPKELGEFSREIGRDEKVIAFDKLHRPPQSWCYAEER